MGTQFLNVAVGRCSPQSHKTDSIMFRFIALFALVAVAFAEPEAEADPQYFYHHMGVPVVKPVVRYSHPQYLQHHMAVPVVKPVAPVVKAAVPVVKPVVPVVQYMDPHHTEGMTKEGVPEKTDSVKIAEKQHEIAQQIEKSKVNVGYVAPYTTYAGVYPYVHPVAHVVAKREAESEADPAYFYNNYATGVYPYTSAVAGYLYTSAVAGYPYTTAVSGYTFPSTYVNHPVVYRGKRDADSDAQLYYSRYASPYAYNYGHPYTYNTPYTYGYNRYGWF